LEKVLDNLTKEKRSKVMASIHSKDTTPELALRKAMWNAGLRFRIQFCKEKIDIAFPAKKVAVFVDGCFWHGCPVHSHKIGSNIGYWQPKLEKNKERDKIKTAKLKSEGWVVLRFWEHELVDMDNVVEQIQQALQKRQKQYITNNNQQNP
jgi:DNA mismatch endonuclease, patch repair protein